MLYRPRSRRQFLVGASKVGGLMLPLPALPSLMPRSAWGASVTPPIRFIQCIDYWGQFDKYFNPQFPSLQTLDAANGVSGAKLTDLPGPISKVIGAGFNDLKPKMNVIKGLNIAAADFDHNGSAPSCASGLGKVNGKFDLPPAWRYSVEYILSNSRKMYPADTMATEKYVGLWRQYGGGYWNYNFAWTPTGNLTMTDDLRVIYAKFARSFNASGGAIDGIQKDRIRLAHEVAQDYKAVIDSGRLSAADRPRFEAYMALVSEVEAKLSAPVKACADPKPQFGADKSCRGGQAICASPAAESDAAKILAAALACQLTRVVDYVYVHPDPLHDLQHNLKQEQHSDLTAVHGQVFANFWRLLDSLKDADGSTVLDNSAAYWCNNAGLADWGAHTYRNMPLVTAGSAGGRFKTGLFLQFGTGGPSGGDKTPARYNNWIVTVFNAMGMTPADYEQGGQMGFGQYSNPADPDPNRRRPLPVLWKG